MIYPLVIGPIIKRGASTPNGRAGRHGNLSSRRSALAGGYLADRLGRVRTLQFTISGSRSSRSSARVRAELDQL